jgi:hypothetical protein
LSQADFNVLKTFLIPVNEPRNVHWLLLGINFESKTISVYDSWPAARGTSDEDVSGHLQPVGVSFSSAYTLTELILALKLSVLAAQIISSASQGKLNFAGQEWDTRRVCHNMTLLTALHNILVGPSSESEQQQ